MAAPGPPAFLGRGWGFPPQFSRLTHSTRTVAGVEDIRESLQILLSTTPGERVMLPLYGCDLRQFLFRALTTSLISEVRDAVRTAILRWEPRIDVLAVDVTIDAEEPGLLRIEVSFQVRRTNIRSNMVYPFYFTEATLRREA